MKTTKATIKSFVRKNNGNLFINVRYSFDGMVDGCTTRNDGFVKVESTTDHTDHTLGVVGAWLVNGSRDYFTPYNKNGYIGYEISNCCGNFILAVKS